MMIYLCAFGALCRLTTYCENHLWPISILGRIATGRLIIPGYDVVFIAPLLMTIAASVIPRSLIALGVTPAAAMGAGAASAIFLGIKLPPSRRRWWLTAPHRITPSLRSQQLQRGSPRRASGAISL
jgi:hypothetical protein